MDRTLFALPLLLAAVACGGTAPSAPPAATGPSAVTTPAVQAAAKTTPAKAKAKAAAAPVRQFWSPSGGITCFLSPVAAVCEAADHTWDLPPKPADCDLDWGGMVEVRKTGAAAVVCAGDTGFGVPPSRTLAYGDALAAGDFRCTSARAGMTCENRATKHGFTVSRAAYTAY